MIDYSTIMSHFHSRTDSHNSGRAQLCFFGTFPAPVNPKVSRSFQDRILESGRPCHQRGTRGLG